MLALDSIFHDQGKKLMKSDIDHICNRFHQLHGLLVFAFDMQLVILVEKGEGVGFVGIIGFVMQGNAVFP